MKKETVLSLGTIQAELASATNELRLAQAGFVKASVRLQEAEERHNSSMSELVNATQTIRQSQRVVPLSLK